MTKEEALQKANEYCKEKAYTSETLTDEFKDKFSDFFAKKYPDTSADDDALIADLKFNIDTAFSATSKGVTAKQKAFEEKENEYKKQIAELNKKIGNRQQSGDKFEIPKELQDQIDELKAYKNSEAKKAKFANVVELAKKGIRQDLHKSFETFANGTDVALDKGDKEQADALVERFQEIFRDSIGEIKPLAPQVTKKRDEGVMSSLKRLKV